MQILQEYLIPTKSNHIIMVIPISEHPAMIKCACRLTPTVLIVGYLLVAEGSITLTDLFQGRSQLLVYHFMFGPDYTAGCQCPPSAIRRRSRSLKAAAAYTVNAVMIPGSASKTY